MKSVTVDLEDRNYNAATFSDFGTKILKLSTVVAVYNDGIKWKAIPLYILNSYPIIYDEYYEQSSDVKTVISIYVCPHTLYSCIYFGKYKLHDKMYNNNITIVNEHDNIWIVPILNKVYSLSTDELIDEYIKKKEIKIITLKNVIYMYPDCQIINIKPIPEKQQIVQYDNKINNKKLIYVIEYKSKNISEYKYTVIIPKHNTFDINKNGFNKYFHSMAEQIRMKGGIIHTCFMDDWNMNKIESKIIEL